MIDITSEKLDSFVIVLMFFLVLLVPAHAQNESIPLKDELKIQEDLTVMKIEQPDPALMFTIAQVSGVFVAIVAGLYTTKLISISSEKNRLRTRLSEIDIEINGKQPLLAQYNGIIDGIENKWADERIRRFVDDLLEEEDLKKYTLKELKEKFVEYNQMKLNEYEEKILTDKFEDITKNIEEKINKGKTFSFNLLGIRPSLLAPMVNLELIRDERKALSDAYRKRAIEESNIEMQKKMKGQLTKELESLINQKHLAFELLFLFIFAMLGVVLPLLYPYWSPHTLWFSPNVVAIVAFLIGLILTFIYLGVEALRVSRIK